MARGGWLSMASRAGSAASSRRRCGGGGIEGGRRKGNVQTVNASGKPSGELTISNWPLYIDKDTVPDFEKATGVSVKYIEDVNDNHEFFGKVQPLLDQGRVRRPLDLRRHRLDGEQDARPRLPPEPRQGRDPERREEPRPEPRSTRRSTPSATTRSRGRRGMTGLIVRTDLAPDIKSICDLFDPKYKGKVDDAHRDARHGAPGHEVPRASTSRKATEQDWLNAIDKIKDGAPTAGRSGASPATTTPSDLPRGDVVAVIGWSGDAVQLAGRQPGHPVRDARRRAACCGRTTW